jgi:hypothetical protein
MKNSVQSCAKAIASEENVFPKSENEWLTELIAKPSELFSKLFLVGITVKNLLAG